MPANYPTSKPPVYTPSVPSASLFVDGHEDDLHQQDRLELRALMDELGLTATAGTLQGYTRLGDAAGKGLWVPAAALESQFAVINGGFAVWQRGTSFASVADGTYTTDRIRYGKVGAMVHDISRSTDVPAVAALVPLPNYSLLVDCTTVDSSIAATDVCFVEQRIEGFNWGRYLAQHVNTWSFWHKHTKVGSYSVALVNSGGDRSCVATYSQAVSDTWELAMVQFPASPTGGTWDYTTGIGARLVFALTAGSNFHTTAGAWQPGLYYATSAQVNACDSTSNNFRLWGIRPARGSMALPFQGLPFDTELLRAKRYYEHSYEDGTTVGTSTDTGAQYVLAQADVATSKYTTVPVPFQVQKRVAPTVTLWDVVGNSGKVTTLAADGTKTNNVSPSSGAGNIGTKRFNMFHFGSFAGVTFHWRAECEL